MKENIGGLAQGFFPLILDYHSVIYLSGTNISINNLAVSQKIGDAGVVGLNIVSAL